MPSTGDDLMGAAKGLRVTKSLSSIGCGVFIAYLDSNHLAVYRIWQNVQGESFCVFCSFSLNCEYFLTNCGLVKSFFPEVSMKIV